MQPFFQYLKYFFYIARNWSISIAIHIIRNEIKGEKKYGINTTGADELQSLAKLGIDITHATIYMPVSYDVIEHFFDKAHIQQCQHFLDIGCGKGRALCVAAAMGATKLSGIELSKALFMEAKANTAITQQQYPNTQINLYHNDAFYFEIAADVDCILMFNPFDEVIMSGVMENIDISLANNPRKMTIIYINPLEKQVLQSFGYKQVYYYKEKIYLEGAIFEK